MEDKKCRVCGQADMDNINIFNSTKLPEKIAAVYPIPLYPNDPLPKHICKKCVVSTVNMYNMIERALLNQTKWISNIRSVQPENQYLKVVDSIAGANKQTSQLVSLIAGSEIGERTICKLFNFKTETLLSNKNFSCKPTATYNHHLSESEKTKEDGEQPTNRIAKESEVAKKQTQAQASPSNSREHPHPKITQMKSVLEQNGCTLTKLKPTTIKSFPGSQKNDVIEEIKVEIKEEPLEEYHPVHLEPTEQQSQPIVENHQVSCKMCRFSCETIEELAIHQLNHLSICSIKLSERRFLDKRIRRGRLIVIESKKCIRCLNCWRIFSDNKSILQHWSEGDCDFFCQICGKEFATSPKMLREHIPAAHGISYRSSKLLRPPTLVPSKPIKTEKTTAKSPVKTPVKSPVKSSPVKKEQLSATPSKTSPSFKKKSIPNNGILTVKVACGICLKVFANFKARNSHMRAHKHPPFLPDKPPPSLSETLMALNRTDMLQIKDEPLDYDNIPSYQGGAFSNDTPAIDPAPAPIIFPSTSAPALNQPPTKHPRLKVIPSRAPTGARKKILQMRPNPSQSVIKTEPGLMPVGNLQVKSLVDLQDPSVSSQLPEEDPNKLYFGTLNPPTALPTPPTDLPSNGTPTINGFSMEPDVCSATATAATPKDNMIYGQIFTCHPCGEKFTSKLELFRHKRKCTANNLFPCQFCERHFVTSADLQMHIMLLHKSTAAQSNLSH